MHFPISKAPGPDGITPEQLYLAREQLTSPITSLLNYLLDGQTIPPALTESTIVLLHKKGSTEKVDNYRPICLLPTIYKAMTKAVLQRVEKCLEEAEEPTQAGFRSRFSTLDHAHSIKQLIEKLTEYNIPSYLALVDFAKAFDSLEWPILWRALSLQGVHQDLIALLQRLYLESKSDILVNGQPVPVSIKRGVRQGCPLSPRLFTAVLRMILNDCDWEGDGIKVNGRNLTHLAYADDIVLIARNRPAMERMLSKL